MSSSGSQRGSIIITIITAGWWFEHGTDSGKHLTTIWCLEHDFYEFPYIGNFIIPTDELHHFSDYHHCHH
jgi:hypothetical protein